MKHTHTQHDDPLLWRVRRSVTKAQTLMPQPADYRKALALAAEIGAEIAQLQRRIELVENEIRAVSHRVTAVSAYQRCAALGRRTRI